MSYQTNMKTPLKPLKPQVSVLGIPSLIWRFMLVTIPLLETLSQNQVWISLAMICTQSFTLSAWTLRRDFLKDWCNVNGNLALLKAAMLGALFRLKRNCAAVYFTERGHEQRVKNEKKKGEPQPQNSRLWVRVMWSEQDSFFHGLHPPDSKRWSYLSKACQQRLW